jgi:glucose/arabinose dehydrogenase
VYFQQDAGAHFDPSLGYDPVSGYPRTGGVTSHNLHNYGWPNIEGNQTSPGIVSPMRAFTEFTLAPSGLAYYQGSLYLAGLRGNQLRQVKLSADGRSVVGEEALFQDLGRIRDVVEHDGYIYISTSNRDGRGIPKSGDDRIIRFKIS